MNITRDDVTIRIIERPEESTTLVIATVRLAVGVRVTQEDLLGDADHRATVLNRAEDQAVTALLDYDAVLFVPRPILCPPGHDVHQIPYRQNQSTPKDQK